MIATGLSLSELGEVYRIDVQSALKVRVRAIADEDTTAVIQVKRAIGSDGPSESFETTKTLNLSSEAPTDIEVEDCSHLSIEVTTAGTGTFDLEWNTQGVVTGWVQRIDIDLSEEGELWKRQLAPFEHVGAIAVKLDSSSGSPALQLLRFIDPESKGYTDEAIDLDGAFTPFELGPVWGFGLWCSTKSDGVTATVWIYTTSTIESAGMERDGIGYLDTNNNWTGSNGFEGNFSIGDLSTGLHTISSASTTNKAVEIPDVEGDFVIMTDLSPAAGEYLTRSGVGYQSTDQLLAGNGSVGAPSIGFASDTDCGLYRVGSDQFSMVAGGNAMLTLQDSGIFTLLSFSAGILNMAASFAWTITCPAVLVINQTASAGATFQLREGTTNGSNYVQIAAPASLASNVSLTLPSSVGSSGDVMTSNGSGVLSFADPAGLDFSAMKSGATQGAAGAAAGELWRDTADNSVKLGV